MQTDRYGIDLLSRCEVHYRDSAGGVESVGSIYDNRSAGGEVREVLTCGWRAARVADIRVFALHQNAVGNVADRNLRDEPGWRGGQINYAQRVCGVEGNIGSLTIFRERNTTGVDRFLIVVDTSVSWRRRKADSLLI